ncbi:HD-GYP domain-containing protein [Streptacidiphilus carbonis]|uniref:HD-GYP domain-containing protein n=1 Tax=Streptacidiphilus carbonis TaxID=105422 RepID=UPI0007C86A83|nr:HD-GYP domain-containing protein [Streptacidiphilus carbonis]
MEQSRRALPTVARVYVALVVAAALGWVLSALPQVRTAEAWSRAAVLALLFLGCDLVARSAAAGDEAAPAAHFPVLLAGALLLPPSAAALVALPAALLAPAAPPRAVRRCWNAAQLGLSAFAGSCAFRALDGHRLLAGVHLPAVLLPAGAAALVFCAVNSLLMGGILAAAESGGRRRNWYRSLLRCPASAFGHGLVGLMMAVLWEGPYGAFAGVLALLPLGVAGWVSAQSQRERAAHRATVRALVQAVEIKDGYTRGHSERVGRAAVLMAGELGMGPERAASLRVAGTLHDVGKLGVPTRLLRKSGPLTDEEYRQVVLHPEYGHELVRGIGFLGEARAGILHHHERMDGRGYPHGLSGTEIPEFARVIAVADAFDSMTSTRSYRRGRPVAEALAELERCAGSQFDPVMVTALVRALQRTRWQPALLGREGEQQAPEVPLGAREPLPRVPAPAGALRAGEAAGDRGGTGGTGGRASAWWRR